MVLRCQAWATERTFKKWKPIWVFVWVNWVEPKSRYWSSQLEAIRNFRKSKVDRILNK